MCDSNDNDNDKNNNSSVNDHGKMSNGLKQRDIGEKHDKSADMEPVRSNFHPQIRWPDLMAQIFLHAGAIYGLIFQFYTIKLATLLWCK